MGISRKPRGKDQYATSSEWRMVMMSDGSVKKSKSRRGETASLKVLRSMPSARAGASGDGVDAATLMAGRALTGMGRRKATGGTGGGTWTGRGTAWSASTVEWDKRMAAAAATKQPTMQCVLRCLTSNRHGRIGSHKRDETL